MARIFYDALSVILQPFLTRPYGERERERERERALPFLEEDEEKGNEMTQADDSIVTFPTYLAPLRPAGHAICGDRH